ncbi:MAG: type II toxin-antitoxin system PemK/MazF family toxin [Cyanobacteria bacterium J06638_22]
MTVRRGDVWLANLNPTQGSEQAGTRPVIAFQENTLSRFTTTVVTIPLTSNLRRAALPTCVQISQGEGGLAQDSVALCHQIRVLDKTRLIKKLGILDSSTLSALEATVLFTLGYSISSFS